MSSGYYVPREAGPWETGERLPRGSTRKVFKMGCGGSEFPRREAFPLQEKNSVVIEGGEHMHAWWSQFLHSQAYTEPFYHPKNWFYNYEVAWQ